MREEAGPLVVFLQHGLRRLRENYAGAMEVCGDGGSELLAVPVAVQQSFTA